MDSKTQHTAGPWTPHWSMNNGDFHHIVPVNAPDSLIAKVDAFAPTNGDMEAEGKANARLIAAAPTMYEGIGDFLAAYDRARIGDWDHGKLIDWLGEQVARLRPVYAKAEGR